jgi:diguanylate cyclase (GGDEF)-like protein/PAS domain S-box-containing protein
MTDTTSTINKPLIHIVADDGSLQLTLQNAMDRAGFITALAPDRASAVAGFNELLPDLIILALVMPGKDGFATCRDIRAIPKGKYTPILMITEPGETESMHSAFEAGATDFIPKPLDSDLLICRIRCMLRIGTSLKRLTESEEQLMMLKEAVDCLPIGITLSDFKGKIIYANPAEADMHGYTHGELIGRDARLFAPCFLRKPFLPGKLRALAPWRRESINIRKTGEEFPVQLSSITVRNVEGKCLGMVTACEDITSRKEAEEKIQRLAYYDSLTGLPNRRTFLDRLQQAVALANRERRQVGLLFLDLDNFKDINDSQGHDFGDKLIREVAERLSIEMRESDTLARLGGDEFVVVLTSIVGQEIAASAAHRILSLFSRPFAIDSRMIYSSASIGIALYPDDGSDIESLLKCADTAMYHAKTRGKSNYRFFSAEMNQRIMRRVALESNLRQGMEKEEFFLHFQPQWDLQTSRMIGVEALLRWQSTDFGLLMPAEFIPLAENSGQIFGLGEWALRSACVQARNWALAGYHDLKVGVNISGLQFRQPDFLEIIGSIIRESGIQPRALELEFTESVIMGNAGKAIETLRSLKKMGVQLTIDNFGTGYSSLSYLKHFPIDRIKIDRSFVADIKQSDDDATIVEAIISMAHSLNLKVIAEGVENSEQLQFLASRNCDEVQGFHLTKPMTAEDLSGNFSETNRNAWGLAHERLQGLPRRGNPIELHDQRQGEKRQVEKYISFVRPVTF